MAQTFKTPKGTELPMLDLRGKPYLQVAHRLVWFREEHPTWAIMTELLEHDATHAIFKASIVAEGENDHTIATATGHETKNDFPDFIEKAETKAVGRALAMVGYGTQFAPELEEGNRLADSPIAPAKFAPPATPDPNKGKTAAAIAPPANPVKKEFHATTEQLTELFGLVKEKLGAKTKEAVLPALNKELGMEYKAASDISRTVATTLIASLKQMTVSTPMGEDEPPESD